MPLVVGRELVLGMVLLPDSWPVLSAGAESVSSVIEKRASVYQCLSPRTKKIKHATERNISNDHRRLVVRKITNMGLMGGYRERTLDTYTKISNRSSAVFDRTLGF